MTYTTTRPRKVTAAVSWKGLDTVNPINRGVHLDHLQGWQVEAWAAFHNVGEIRFPFSQLARSTVQVDWKVTVGSVELTEHEYDRISAKVHRGIGEDEATRRLMLNLLIAGDATYLELERQMQVLSVVDPNARQLIHDAETNSRGWWRVHLPDPTNPDWGDSSVRAVLGPIADLQWLERLSRANSHSRASNAGILITPKVEGMSEAYDLLVEAINRGMRDPRDAAALSPIHVEIPDKVDRPEVMTLAPALDEKLADRFLTAQRRIAVGIDAPPELITGMGDVNHWCVDESTEVLTADGWRRHDEIAVGDMIRTLNHETGAAEWHPILDIYRAEVIAETMLSVELPRHSSLTTPNHRWPTVQARSGQRRWRTTSTLSQQDRVLTGVPSADTPTDTKWSDALVELVAWAWTEGNRGEGGSWSIAQSHTVNPQRVALIRGALTSLFGVASGTTRGVTVPAWREGIQANTRSFGGPITVFHLNRAASDVLSDAFEVGKHVRADWVLELTVAQLELFIDRSAQGDGQHYRRGELDMWQRDPRALDAYELALILSGRSVSRQTSEGGHHVGAPRRSWIAPVKPHRPVEVAYSGTLWCPVTATGTWLARRRGTVYYTGNSAWAIQEDTWRSHLASPMQMVGDLYATVHEAIETLPAGSVTWTADPSRLFARKSTIRDALDAHTARAVSGKYVRSVLGVTEEEAAPTEEDFEIWSLTSIPALGEAPVDAQPGPPRTGREAGVAAQYAVHQTRARLGAKLRSTLGASAPDVPNHDLIATVGLEAAAKHFDVDAEIRRSLSAFGQWWATEIGGPAPNLAAFVAATVAKPAAELEPIDLNKLSDDLADKSQQLLKTLIAAIEAGTATGSWWRKQMAGYVTDLGAAYDLGGDDWTPGIEKSAALLDKMVADRKRAVAAEKPSVEPSEIARLVCAEVG